MAYTIANPKIGRQILQAKYQSWQDSKHSASNYAEKKSQLDDIIKALFPESSYSIADFRKDAARLQVHASDFFNKLKNESYPSKKKPYPLEYTLDNNSGLFLYALCKIVKPKIVVETGVAYGLSSMYILQALFENKKGTLYSIDSVFSPWQSEEMIGSAIPSHLCENWRLVFGSSSEKLKDTLYSLGSLDVFFHDSLHTYKNMKFEFETAWPFVNKGGFLISDDISGNNAFSDFYSKLSLEPFILPQNEKSFLGILKKP
ncbi:class I SAM-dependent methyltransferase [Candidatus Nitrosotenuis chungbukensis]|uniref:class I SAM-dependent methyltransferase n=1 Tax=Candidatus Nitrosotenuis chungbukensis TaxID=1353246 RepID=UPI0006932334|nr:class I SAM-dependent methyltransferase [Candidatus Nitrosotenuis chungbukensis]